MSSFIAGWSGDLSQIRDSTWFRPMARLGPPLHWQKRDTQWSAWPSLKNKTIKMLYNGWTWLLNKCQTWWTTCSDSTGVRKSWNVMKCHEISWIAYLDDSRSFQRKLPTHEHWPNLQSTVGLWMQDVMCRSKPLRFAGSALRSSCSHHYRRRARLAINFYSSFQCTYCTEVTVSVSTLTKSIWE